MSSKPEPNVHGENSRKVALPAYLVRRCEAFRIVAGNNTSYVIRDKLQDKTWDFEPWQFFVLEVLPGCETLEKLQSVFRDRYDRGISEAELQSFFGTVADWHLFDETALQHPLLAVYAHRTYEVVDGKAVPRSYASMFRDDKASAQAKSRAGARTKPEAEVDPEAVLPAGVQDVPGVDRRTMGHMIDLFDPRPILNVVAPILAPLRYVIYAFPAMLIVALLLLVERWQFFMGDVQALHSTITIGTHLLFSMLTVNVASVIFRACLAHQYGIEVERIGIMFFAGFVPRFEVGVRHLDKLNRKQRMWYHGGNLLLRGVLLCVGLFAWFFTIDNAGTVANEAALMLVLTCWGSLIIETGNPFARGSTYFLLATCLEEPKLRAKAQRALLNRVHRKTYEVSDSNVLAVYGLACCVYVSVLIVVLTLALGHWLASDLRLGMGAFLVSSAICLVVLWRYYKVMRRYNEFYERSQQFDRWRTRTLVTEQQEEGETESRSHKHRYWVYAGVICLLLVLFIPFQYDPSGSAKVYPLHQQVISTDTPGLIEHVYFDGGETVKKGTVIATLAHEDYQSKIKVYDAEIVAQQAVIANLRTLPKPEAIKVAKEQLRVAETQAHFSSEKVPRIEKLYKAGAVPLEELETDRKQAATDASQVQEKIAALTLAETGPTPDEIATAEAKLVSLQQQRAVYQDKLDRTILRMPFDGNILTLHLQDRTGTYLNKGDPFCAVEYTGTVTAQVNIDEADLQYVRIGDKVRLRPTAYFDRQFDGVVTQIDRHVTSKPSGTYVAIIAAFDNPRGVLKTGMTGQAKISGVTMPVWSAFSQSIQHFFNVEVWSWIP